MSSSLMLLDLSYLVRKLCYSSEGNVWNVLAKPQPLEVISKYVTSPKDLVFAT